MDLLEIRGLLDQIDTKIETLFEERMRLCGEVAEYKIATGKAVYDAKREQEKIESLTAMADTEFNKQAVGELFLQMMTLSRRYQYQTIAERIENPDLGFQKTEKLCLEGKKIAFQGLEGAYGHAAAIHFFGKEASMHHVRRFEDLMIEVQEGNADFGVLPIENSSAGAVTDNYDLLLKYNNYIVAETKVPVCHCLLGTPDAEVSDIKRVYAHPQALMQSSEYLNAKKDWQQLSMENNAVAAKKIRDEKDKTQAAVASEIAGEIYGLKVLQKEICNTKDNTTRFLILSKDPVYRADAQTVSLCFELPHTSGSLYNMLGNFIFNHVNMKRIESRPVPEQAWEYRFFVDIEGNLDTPAVRNALYGIQREAKNVKILGCY